MSPRDRRERSVLAAARNSAEWCDSLCGTHGIRGRFDSDAWITPRRTPRLYPDAITLDPAADAGSILERIDLTSPGASIKDSFATLDLSPLGFRVVREAEWIQREPSPAGMTEPRDRTWTAIETADDLVVWEAAWHVDGAPEGLFRPALQRDPSVTILGGHLDASIVAGAIANRTGRGVIGLSNVFSSVGDLEGAWRGILGYLDATLPGAAVVGYAAGVDLDVAHLLGFRSVGPLRIWVRGSDLAGSV